MRPISYISFQGNKYSIHCLKQHQIYGQSLQKLPWINIHFKRINMYPCRSKFLIFWLPCSEAPGTLILPSAVQQVTCYSPFQTPHLATSREAWIHPHTNLHAVMKDCLFIESRWLGYVIFDAHLHTTRTWRDPRNMSWLQKRSAKQCLPRGNCTPSVALAALPSADEKH